MALDQASSTLTSAATNGVVGVSAEKLRGWHVVASSTDLALRHVFHARVGEYNLALWRSDDGQVNAWENRCPHRSVPLTMGINLGKELRCQYHGWRFSTGSGECTTVPAQPNDPANRSACVSTFDCVEQDGWVWVALKRPGRFGLSALAPNLPRISLRAVAFHVAAEALTDVLRAEWGNCTLEQKLSSGEQVQRLRQEGGFVRFHVQVQSESSCVLHAQWLPNARLPANSVLRVLREFNHRLTRLRDRLESQAGASLSLVLPEPTVIPMLQSERRRQQLVKVAKKVQTAHDVVAFELVSSEGGALHGFEAGAHIEVKTPIGLLRHYSLVNGPGERRHYVIGVKRDPASRGGSKSMCDDLNVGDTLSVGLPVNRFALRPIGPSVLIAGGIGITPLIAMAQQLEVAKRDYVLNYFVRGAEHVAFADRIRGLGVKVKIHAGLDVTATREAIAAILVDSAADAHFYVCGPGPMIDLVVQTAHTSGVSDEQVHREYFGNDKLAVQPDDKTFEVVLQRSGKVISVPPGRSIADLAKELGVAVNTVCEQGACGTCEVVVLDGVPDHRDVYLSPKERASNRCTMVCVSRAKTSTLVLDL